MTRSRWNTYHWSGRWLKRTGFAITRTKKMEDQSWSWRKLRLHINLSTVGSHCRDSEQRTTITRCYCPCYRELYDVGRNSNFGIVSSSTSLRFWMPIRRSGCVISRVVISVQPQGCHDITGRSGRGTLEVRRSSITSLRTICIQSSYPNQISKRTTCVGHNEASSLFSSIWQTTYIWRGKIATHALTMDLKLSKNVSFI